MNWYYVEGGRQAGPVDEAGLNALVASGKIRPETLVWREGMANWQAYREIQSPSAGGSPAGEAVCAECGGRFPVNDTVLIGGSRVCANCKPVFVQKMREGVNVGEMGQLQYAGFWIRFAAQLLDNLIMGAVCFIVMMMLSFAVTISLQPTAGAQPNSAFIVVGLLFYFFIFAIPCSYEVFMIGKYGATLGKMACRIRVVRANGIRVSYGLAVGRFFSKIVSYMICYIGFMLAGWDVEKRALHDHMCSTRVVHCPIRRNCFSRSPGISCLLRVESPRSRLRNHQPSSARQLSIEHELVLRGERTPGRPGG